MSTTSEVWLGLTAGCARCHDHKFDPLTQKEFYSMYSYFNNVPESGTGVEQPVNHPPIMDAPTAAQTARLKELTASIAKLDGEIDKKIEANSGRSEHWQLGAQLPRVDNGLVKRYAFTPGGKDFTASGTPAFSAGRATGAVGTDDKSYLDLGDVGDFENDHPFSFGAWINPNKLEGSPLSRMDSGNAFRGWECSFAGAGIQAHLINKWPENAIKVHSTQMIPVGKWTHVFFTYDGSKKAAGFKIYVDGRPVEAMVDADSLTDTIRTNVTVKVGRRTNSETFDGKVDDVAIYDRALSAQEVATLASTHPAITLLKIPEKERTADQKREIARLWSLEHDKKFAEMDTERTNESSDLIKLKASIPNVMVMEEMPQPRECHVLIRGQYDKPGEEVKAGVPSFLPPLPKGAPNNRLGFAEWIVSPDNPLTARVTMNRLWARFFGTGIVKTIEDFGTRAEFPSHPELLDWLATEFLRTRWDMKAMVKEMVMSASYRQDSDVTAEKLSADPENRLISRGPRFRLNGEVIRDQALYVSGLLVERLGGPSVYPYMPPGIWDETNFYGNLRDYKHATDDGLYRRSLYTIWKRTAAPPNMLLFDVPSRETCTVNRPRTDTPLQALTLMNDETYVEAARVLAQRMMREGGNTMEGRLQRGFELVLQRPATAQELKILEDGIARRTERYRNDRTAAWDLVSTGESRVDIGLDIPELAAYTMTASTLLNLDETITKE
ncbi:MAG TPA: DUF1553 domain-containing protein, partial [Fimbriimonadaceae bacterium]|nr:DUF1553 domain-containing protein [Fimbriimonadaceae bacterium]